MTAKSLCFKCGMLLDRYLEAWMRPPIAGSVSICFYCSHIAVYTGNGLEIRQPGPEELISIVKNKDVQFILYTIEEYKRTHTHHGKEANGTHTSRVN